MEDHVTCQQPKPLRFEKTTHSSLKMSSIIIVNIVHLQRLKFSARNHAKHFTSFHLILTTLWGRNCYHPSSTVEEIKDWLESLCNSFKVRKLEEEDPTLSPDSHLTSNTWALNCLVLNCSCQFCRPAYDLTDTTLWRPESTGNQLFCILSLDQQTFKNRVSSNVTC